ncbi:alpha/beta hydrolase [Winogradskyella bathintestinalis]|uniref:Alpha/beta hydrolase n=1 Tax=Winogradskyella bathintestinalis TaxID=3035208 RepID=A0ABT7ZSU9_9FLAO|nr:alpha/beta hydrolase [Winogradskyella bathintestinalis]MDN3491828.1 alpha/beta hydrolase [Winogradskyella bathintestinalis]
MFSSLLFACDSHKDQRYIFFLHNRFIETHALDELHPQYGKTEYLEIICAFENYGFNVFSEIRKGNVDVRDYAASLVTEIDSLISTGVNPKAITIIGTSKGGYIAQYVSTFANNPNLNFVFIASFRNEDLHNISEINYCGNILNIFEKTDPFGVSAIERRNRSTCNIKNFKEIELDTKLGHGFLFRPLDEWIAPSVTWANGFYDQ